MLRTQARTEQQQTLANELAAAHNINAEQILFLNEQKPLDPWINPESLTTIGRQSDIFRSLDEGFQEYIASLDQVVHHATFIDSDGRTFGRSGIATVKKCEQMGLDPHVIAAGRAISASLNSGGINPLKPGSVIPNGKSAPTAVDAANAETRRADLARIHELARKKELIVGQDFSGYRGFLVQHEFYKGDGLATAAHLKEPQRKSLIEALENYQPSSASMPPEFAELDKAEGAVAS